VANAASAQDLAGSAAARSWVFQTCNEFGYFQTSRASREHRTLYTDPVSDPSLWTGICDEVYQISNVDARIARTRSVYDWKDIDANLPTNTVFVNGADDPWSALGRTNLKKLNNETTTNRNVDDKERQLFSMVIPKSSHCVGLYGNPNDARVVPDAQRAQVKMVELLKGWVSDYSTITTVTVTSTQKTESSESAPFSSGLSGELYYNV